MSLTPFSEKLISFLITDALILTGVFGFVIIGSENADAQIIEVAHDAGNLDFLLDEHATLPFSMSYQGVQQSDKIGGWQDETFFFFDQSNYDHSGTGDIATGRSTISGGDPPEFQTTSSDIPLSLLENGVVDKSFGTFTKVKDIKSQKNDVRILQTAWSQQNANWGIIQWTAQNLYDWDLTEVRFGLRFYSAAGGDNADDKAHWHPNENVFYITDSGSSTYFGFASADPQIPVNLYWDGSINDLVWDSDIYNAAVQSPHISGFHNDLGCIVGWTDDETANNGLNISAKESLTRALIMGVGTSFNDLLIQIEKARDFYVPRTLQITEISDEGTPKVEIHTISTSSVDITDYGFSVDGGQTYWDGGFWDADPIPGEGYSVWTLSGNDSFDSSQGATLGLYNISSNVKMDEVAFGLAGAAPDPINDAAIGSISKVGHTRWVHSLNGMTFGGANFDNVSVSYKPEVIINEVSFNPASKEYGFIELMYTGDTELDTLGFSILTNKKAILQSHTLTFDDPYYLIFRNDVPLLFDSGAMDKSQDNVYLYDDKGNLLDMVGWSNAHLQNKTVARVIEGEGEHSGYNDATSISEGWRFDSQPTIPLVLMNPRKQHEFGDCGDQIWYNLSISNKMKTKDHFDILSQHLPGWKVEIYEKDKKSKVDDSDGDSLPDISVDGETYVDFAVQVIIPQNEIFGDYADITITAVANLDIAYRHNVILQTRFYPYILPKKSVTPNQIYLKGNGSPENATITLEIVGSGFGIPSYKPQDIVFTVDRSNSMLPSEIDLAKQALTEFVDNMSSPDRGCIVHFDSNVVLMSSLTGNYLKLKKDIENIPGPGELTYMGEALYEALKELNNNGQNDKAHVIILLTDGAWNGDLDPITVANWARENDTLIFTIGLGDGAYNVLLKEIADITGAENFTAETIDEFRLVYEQIAYYLDKTAGRDPDTGDSNPMIRDVLPPGIDVIPGSFSIEPDYLYVDDLGYTIMEWNRSIMFINEDWNVSFNITSSNLGYQEANNFTSSRVSYINWDGLQKERLFPRTMINVIIPQPLPPILSIEAVDDIGNIKGTGDSIKLKWNAPFSPGISHYLIYRSDDQRNFDFQTPWVQTDIYDDNGIIPLRTTLNDTYASKLGSGNFAKELYYVIRAVNSQGEVSGSSRTVGKWTREFEDGTSTFSLPLMPIQNHDAIWYAKDMDADYIRWMDQDHKWAQSTPLEKIGESPDILLGKGYEVHFTGARVYTFLGCPAAMIRYESTSFGFSILTNEVKSLKAVVDNLGNVTLSWILPSNMNPNDRFHILRSTSRDGFWGNLNEDYYKIADLPYNILEFQDLQIAQKDTEFYYMVVPVNTSTQDHGTSSYSTGVVTLGFDSGYDTFGLPLKQESEYSVDWFCDDISFALGINFHLYNEQRWIWHKRIMPSGAYDTQVSMSDGYQISTTRITGFSFIGI